MRKSETGTSGQRKIFFDVSLAVLLSCQLAVACSADSHRHTGSDYMLDQASGLQLGMKWGEVHRERPATLRDSYRIGEARGPLTHNTYYFGKGDEIDPGSTAGTLKAVVMEKGYSIGDSAAYQQLIRTTAQRWSQAARQEPEVFQRTLVGPSGFAPLKVKILRWVKGNMVLVIVHGAQPDATDSRSLLFRAIVKCSGVSLPETSGLKLPVEQSFSSC